MNYKKFESSTAVEDEPGGIDRDKLKFLILRLLHTEYEELIHRLSLDLETEEEGSSHYTERKKQAEEIVSYMEKRDDGLRILHDEIFAVAPMIQKEKN